MPQIDTNNNIVSYYLLSVMRQGIGSGTSQFEGYDARGSWSAVVIIRLGFSFAAAPGDETRPTHPA